MRIPLLTAGGGIGGLAAALALARQGRPAHVLERAPQFAEIGAGLQFAPNATRMLHALGLLDEVLRTAVRPRRLVMRDAVSGDGITSLDLWTRHDITLLGDAAHPMLQYAAQGACQALEDAVALGDAFAAYGHSRRAFQAYEARRRPRASRVQQIARWLGDLFHVSGSDAARRRELLAPAGGEFEHFDWLYGPG